MTLEDFWTLRTIWFVPTMSKLNLFCSLNILLQAWVSQLKICNGRGAWNSAKLCLLPVTEGTEFSVLEYFKLFMRQISLFLLFSLRFLFMITSMPSGLTDLTWHPLWTHDLIKTPFVLQLPFLCLPRGFCESVWDTDYSTHYVFSSYCQGALKMESYSFQSLLSRVHIRK